MENWRGEIQCGGARPDFTSNLQVGDQGVSGGIYDRIMSEVVFAEIFIKYRQSVVAWCYRISRDRDAADDLAQEVFLKAFRNRHAFRGDSSVSTWLYAIARNHTLTALRRRPHHDVPLDTVMHADAADQTAVNPYCSAELDEASQCLLRLMVKALDPVEVRVMTLHYGHDVPLDTITRQLSLNNPSGAKAFIVNARRKMRAALRRTDWRRAAWLDEVMSPAN